MSAPVKERTRGGRGDGAVRTAAAPSVVVPDQRRGPRRSGAARAAAAAPATGTGRVEKAYARREQRQRRLAPQPVRAASTPVTAGRAPFVMVVMALLGIGLVATLWLSTAAAADSYRLQAARDTARSLGEQSERLQQEVAAMEAAPALAQRAEQLGMIPVTDAARLVVAPGGAVSVVGTPSVAYAPVVRAPAPAPSAPPPPQATPAAGPPAAGPGAPAATPAARPGTAPSAAAATPAARPGTAPSAAAATPAARPGTAPSAAATRAPAAGPAARPAARTTPAPTAAATPARSAAAPSAQAGRTG